MKVDHDLDPADPSPHRLVGDVGVLLALTNGVTASLGSVYLATRSVLITVIAGGVLLLTLAGLLIARR